MGLCVVYGCKNGRKKSFLQGLRISFHRFPNDPEQREKWIRAIGRYNWTPSSHSRICSDHFEEDDLDNSSPFRCYLNKDAVPSILKAYPPNAQPSKTTSKKTRVLKRLHSPISSPVPDMSSTGRDQLVVEEERKDLVETKRTQDAVHVGENLGVKTMETNSLGIHSLQSIAAEEVGSSSVVSTSSLPQVVHCEAIERKPPLTRAPDRVGDECKALSMLWISKLKKLDRVQRVIAEDLISHVLTQAFFEELTRSTQIRDGVSYKLA